jgi:hypothetical protein
MLRVAKEWRMTPSQWRNLPAEDQVEMMAEHLALQQMAEVERKDQEAEAERRQGRAKAARGRGRRGKSH